MASTSPSKDRRWRDPFLWFAAGGLILFLLAASLESRQDSPSEEKRLLISHAVQAELRTQFERAQGRPPTEQEQAATIERHVRDQILFEQAIEWDLHRNDVVVRRRLIERLRMIFGSYADISRDEMDLRTTYEKYQDRFREPASIGFRQVFIDRDLHGEGSLARARALREELERSGSVEGDLWYQSPTEVPRSLPRIGALMGRDFATALDTLAVGSWSPPVESSYGYHLVFVEEKIPARMPPLDEVLEQVWVLHRREREQASFADFSDRLRERYEVIIEQGPSGDERDES